MPGDPPAELAIRRVRAEEWPAFRALRLEALRTDPLAFGSTLERELEFPEAEWQRRVALAATGTREATFVVIDPAGAFVGMVGCFPDQTSEIVYGMYLTPALRGRGLGGRLLDTLLDWFMTNLPETPVWLDVNPTAESAARAYLARGFTFDGRERDLGHHPPAKVLGMHWTDRARARRTARPGPTAGVDATE
jgi:RimJ/RimL family protein N-acetyltransferase